MRKRMGYIGLFILIEIAVAIGVYMILPRRACIVLGMLALLAGVAAPLAIWAYAHHFVAGDPSSYGMLGTLMAVLFAPAGIALTVLGLTKESN